MFKKLQELISKLQGKPSEKELLKRQARNFLIDNWKEVGIAGIGIFTIGILPTVIGGGIIIGLRKWLQE